jgi:hypothetical protein
MNRTQKEAMCSLIFFTVTLVFVVLILAARLIFKKDVVYITYFMLATIAITNVLGLLYVLRKQSPREVITDERDAAIKQKALNLAYGIFWYAFVFGSLIAYLILGPMSSMPTGVFVIMILGGAILLRFVWSIAVIIQYGINSKQKTDFDLAQAQG